MNQFLTLILISLFTLSAQAQDFNGMDITEQKSLNVADSSVSAVFHYPGQNEWGICAVQVIASRYGTMQTIDQLVQNLDVYTMLSGSNATPVHIVNKLSFEVKILPWTYVDGVSIVTKDGSSLGDTISRALGPHSKVIMRPRFCNSSDDIQP